MEEDRIELTEYMRRIIKWMTPEEMKNPYKFYWDNFGGNIYENTETSRKLYEITKYS
jgi:hypothetical protein